MVTTSNKVSRCHCSSRAFYTLPLAQERFKRSEQKPQAAYSPTSSHLYRPKDLSCEKAANACSALNPACGCCDSLNTFTTIKGYATTVLSVNMTNSLVEFTSLITCTLISALQQNCTHTKFLFFSRFGSYVVAVSCSTVGT